MPNSSTMEVGGISMSEKKVLTEKDLSPEKVKELQEFAAEALAYEEEIEAKTNLYIKAFPVSLKVRLKAEAGKKHLSYSSYIKMVLQEHIDSLKQA